MAISEGFPGYQSFAVDVSYVGTKVVLALRGELDLWTKPQFVSALAFAQAHEVSVVLDLAELSFIDAGNIRAIHEALKLARMRGTSLALRSPRPGVQRVLDITGLGPAVSNNEESDSPALLTVSRYAYESPPQPV